MRRSPFAALGVSLAAVGVVLAGCAAPAPAETPAASSPAESTPTPTVEPTVIGPAEMPPVAFGGACAAALTPEDIAEVTGRELRPVEDTYFEPSIDNVGGLRCSWAHENYGGGSLRVGIIPRAGLDGVEMPADRAETYFVDCGTWVCAWQGGDDAVWIALTFQYGSEMTRETVDRWGEALGERIIARYADSAVVPWVRDRSGWWPAFECEQLAEAVGAQLGVALEGSTRGYEDIPAPEQWMAGESSRETRCDLTGEGGDVVLGLWTAVGQGGSFMALPDAPPATPIDLGVPGITAQTTNEESVTLVDGVNRAYLFVYESTIPLRDLAVAVGAAAASDFQ